MGSGFSKMKKQQKAMQEQFAKMQEEMQQTEHKGSAGNGLVEVTLNGEKTLKAITIKPECVDPSDIEGLQDLILAAFHEAEKKIESESPMGALGNFM